MNLKHYTVPTELMQGVLNLLMEMPARVSRGLLNDLETVCHAQEVEAAEKAEQARFDELCAQRLKAEAT